MHQKHIEPSFHFLSTQIWCITDITRMPLMFMRMFMMIFIPLVALDHSIACHHAQHQHDLCDDVQSDLFDLFMLIFMMMLMVVGKTR